MTDSRGQKSEIRGQIPIKEGEAVSTRKQITVFLDNKPGRLANVLSELARQKVNIVALAVMDRSEQAVLRLVTDDEALAATFFQGSQISFTETEVLAVELKNQPGALAHVCEVLAAEHINVEYAYCSSGGRNGKVFGIFKVSNLAKAQKVLAAGANNRKPERRALRDQRTYKGTR
jgi:hypothetical protein